MKNYLDEIGFFLPSVDVTKKVCDAIDREANRRYLQRRAEREAINPPSKYWIVRKVKRVYEFLVCLIFILVGWPVGVIRLPKIIWTSKEYYSRHQHRFAEDIYCLVWFNSDAQGPAAIHELVSILSHHFGAPTEVMILMVDEFHAWIKSRGVFTEGSKTLTYIPEGKIRACKK